MSIENLAEKMKKVPHNATEAEIEAMRDYLKEAEELGYFEDYFKVWADEEIKKLQNQLKEAEALISLIASPVEFYCEVGERSKQAAALSYQLKYMNKSGER